MQQFISHYEGVNDSDDLIEAVQYFEELDINAELASPPDEPVETFFTSLETMRNAESETTVNILADNAFKHRITCSDNIIVPIDPQSYVYTCIDSRYNESEFKGLLIDSDVVTRFIGGIGQFKALQQLTKLQLDETTAESAKITFDIDSTTSIDSINLNTPLETIVFHIVQVNTSFLLCLADLDKLDAFFNNITNQIVQNKSSHSIIRRYDHAFLLWHTSTYSITVDSLNQNPCYLIDVELRRLHRRFGHPSIRRLHQILDRAGHNVETRAIEHLVKYCHHCQKHEKSPERFSFIIKNDVDFNYNIIVDILYIEFKPVLHIVDESTRFQTDR
jgi:hypothetical protein